MTKSTTPAVKVVDAVVDTVYQGYINDVVTLTRRFETSTLEWYWKVGEVFHNFLEDLKTKKLEGRSVEHFCADMAAKRVTLGESTAYAARQIHLHYSYENLPAMVGAGVTVGHLKVLGPLDENVRHLVEPKMLIDGTAVPIRDLEALVQKAKASFAQSNAQKALNAPSEPPKGRAPEAPAAPPAKGGKEVVDSTSDDDGYNRGQPKASTPDTPALPTPAKGEARHGTEREFSQSPLKAFKTFDKHAIATLGAVGDTLIAAKEGVKVGFNSDKARSNFTEGLDGAIGTAQGLLEALGPLLEQLREAKKNV